MKQLLVPALALALLTQCRKSAPDPAKPEDQLPPATQTGANTFGCLLNGQPWVPSGGGLFSNPNLLITYDPAYKGGNLAITAYRVLDSTSNKQYIGVGGDGINQVGSYPLTTYTTNPIASLRVASFSDGSKTSPCNEYSSAPGTKATGQLILTRLDNTQGIVSGTFNFTLSQPGCDTVKVTQGRFDYKL
jgi:hypothetical protein